jgi:hypothetical protein
MRTNSRNTTNNSRKTEKRFSANSVSPSKAEPKPEGNREMRNASKEEPKGD